MHFWSRLVILFTLLVSIVVADTETPTVSSKFDAVTLTPTARSVSYDLRTYFTYPGITGTVVQFDTVLGTFNAQLLDTTAPITVANFLSYMNKGAYTNSIIHRAVSSYLIQGGGYYVTNNTVTAIATDAAITNEFKESNARGTIAMAKVDGSVNSATSQWFVNVIDNSSTLNTTNGGYAVFAKVISDGMDIVDTISALSTYDATSNYGSAFATTPLRGSTISISNLVLVSSVKVVPVFPTSATSGSVVKFTVTSSNPFAVNPTVSGSTMTLDRLNPGTSTIFVTATDTNGRKATTYFTVTSAAAVIPSFTTQPASTSVREGSTLSLSVVVSGSPTPTLQWRFNGTDIAGATSTTLNIDNVKASNAGTYTVVATNSGGSVTSNDAVVTVLTDVAPVIDMQPIGASLPAGATLALNVSVSGSPTPTLQWRFNGTDINGATGATLLVENLSSANVGKYTVVATNSKGSVTSQEAVVALSTSNASLISALSVRSYLGASDRVMVGYITSGSRKLFLSGVGLGLANWGVPAASCMADPKIEFYGLSNGSLVKQAENDNWKTALPANYSLMAGRNDADAALERTVNGVGTTHLFGGAGIAMTEVYDMESGMSGRLTAISARSYSGKGDQVLMAGFVVTGDCAKTVVIRGVGQSMGIANAMANPVLDLYQINNGSASRIARNDDWQPSVESAMLKAMGTTSKLSSSKDSVLIITLPPGIYSAHVHGVNDTEGDAMVEVYEMP